MPPSSTDIRNSPSGKLKPAGAGGGGIQPPAGQIDGTELDPLIVGITESGGAELDVGAIVDGQFVKRIGMSLVGVAGNLLATGTASGQQPFWDGTAWRLIGLLTGTDLTDANQTLTIAGGSQYILQSSVPLTANRDKRLALAGASAALMFTIYSLGTRNFTMVVKDDAAGTTLFTFPASSTPIVASFRLNDLATAYTLAGWSPLATVV